jgi:hypothetical protein
MQIVSLTIAPLDIQKRTISTCEKNAAASRLFYIASSVIK